MMLNLCLLERAKAMAAKKGTRINRCASKKQKDLNVKILYVYEDGRVKVQD
jgi:hypothetical protein